MKIVQPPSFVRNKKFSLVIAITSLSLALPVFAIERQVEEEAPHSKQPQKMEAFLGLGGAPVSKTLSLHLGLAEGRGLTLFHIIPDSAADKAGLKPHDIMTSFDGKMIGSQQDLREAIAPHKPGDKVAVKYIHTGKVEERQIELGGRPAHQHTMRGGPGINPRWMFQGLGGEVPEADRKRMEEQMKQHIEKLQRQLKVEGGMELNLQGLKEQGREAQRKDPAFGFQMNSSTSVTMSDDEGSITMTSKNGKKEVVVKNKKGEAVFEGPYDTAQDKAALPDDIRDRVRKLKMDGNGGNMLRLQIGPEGVEPDPMPDEDEDAQ